jgi:hypothetical protein
MSEQRSLNGLRARIQRYGDGRFFSGWIQDHQANNVSIQATPDVVLSVGEKFHFEVVHSEGLIVFDAILEVGPTFDISHEVTGVDRHAFRQIIAAVDLDFEFKICTPMRILSSQEEPRKVTQTAHGVWKSDAGEHGVQLLNISRSGVGLFSEKSMEPHALGKLELKTSVGAIDCEAEVRYCRCDPQNPGVYQAGVSITRMDRVNRARWAWLMAA